jgi:hypothetical protein
LMMTSSTRRWCPMPSTTSPSRICCKRFEGTRARSDPPPRTARVISLRAASTPRSPVNPSRSAMWTYAAPVARSFKGVEPLRSVRESPEAVQGSSKDTKVSREWS